MALGHIFVRGLASQEHARRGCSLSRARMATPIAKTVTRGTSPMIALPPPDVHIPFEDTPMPVAALAADYPHAAFVSTHRHRRAQLLYAIEGVMLIEARAGRWVVPPTRASLDRCRT